MSWLEELNLCSIQHPSSAFSHYHFFTAKGSSLRISSISRKLSRTKSAPSMGTTSVSCRTGNTAPPKRTLETAKKPRTHEKATMECRTGGGAQEKLRSTRFALSTTTKKSIARKEAVLQSQRVMNDVLPHTKLTTATKAAAISLLGAIDEVRTNNIDGDHNQCDNATGPFESSAPFQRSKRKAEHLTDPDDKLHHQEVTRPTKRVRFLVSGPRTTALEFGHGQKRARETSDEDDKAEPTPKRQRLGHSIDSFGVIDIMIHNTESANRLERKSQEKSVQAILPQQCAATNTLEGKHWSIWTKQSIYHWAATIFPIADTSNPVLVRQETSDERETFWMSGSRLTRLSQPALEAFEDHFMKSRNIRRQRKAKDQKCLPTGRA